MQKWIFVASLCLAAALVFVWLEIDWTMDARRQHAPHPDDLVRVGNEMVSQETLLLTRIFPRETIGTFRYELLRRRNLYPLLYVVCGLAGACAAIWLLLVNDKFSSKGTNWDRVGASILLSGLAGVIAYLLVKWLAATRHADEMTLYDSFEVFPLLAGAFNTVFYDALPAVLSGFIGLFKKSGGGAKTASHLLFIVLTLAIPRSISAQSAPEDKSATKASRVYYRCADPSSCKCWAFTKEEKDACKSCAVWQPVSIDPELHKMLEEYDPDKYRDHAGEFARDVAEQMQKVDFGDKPVSAAAVYGDPSRFGLKEIPAKEAGPRTLVVYPKLAGVVVDDKGSIAYPSQKLGGKAAIARPKSLAPEGTPKYLVAANVQ